MYSKLAMSGTIVIVIVVLAILVVVGGSILVLGLNRREHRTPSDAHQAKNGEDLQTAGDQRSDSPNNLFKTLRRRQTVQHPRIPGLKIQAVMRCFRRIGPHCRLAPPNQTDDTLGRWGPREASGTNNQDPPYDETSHSRHHAVAGGSPV